MASRYQVYLQCILAAAVCSGARGSREDVTALSPERRYLQVNGVSGGPVVPGYALASTSATSAPLDSVEFTTPGGASEDARVAFCAQACSNRTSGCAGFFYVPATGAKTYYSGRCWVLQAPGTYNGGFVTLPTALKYSAKPSDPQGFMYASPLLATSKAFLKLYTAGSLAKCAAACTADTACQGFTYLTFADPRYPDCALYPKLEQPFYPFPDVSVHTATFWKLIRGVCTVSNWSDWGPCVNGKQTATRTIIFPGTGKACPDLVKVQSCGGPCVVSNWTDWGPCVNGTQLSTRQIVQAGTPCDYELTRKQSCTSGWMPYIWTALDTAIMKYNYISQPALCADLRATFTQGRNADYPGCGAAWCCLPVTSTRPAWRRYGWSNLERRLIDYQGSTFESLCKAAGAVWTEANNAAYPGCGSSVCCIPAKATFPAWRPYGWSVIERNMIEGGRTPASLCADAGGNYTV